MRARFLLCACLTLTAFGQGADAKPVMLQPIKPTVAKTKPPAFHAVKVQHRSSTPWWHVSCEANWDQRCEGSGVIAADAGWQVCRAVYVETTSDGHDAWFRVEPQNFFPGDPQQPPRFHQVKWTIHAAGNGNPFDHRGSKEVVENLHVDMIPYDASNYLRAQENCWMPAAKKG
jgi:hypothetical protein